ncbi:MAG: hypothetical protein E1N59_1775 [Puniceicoccaceae bacterium 5H]|nr:MAG: hypothetical protein E1N59_1775 [Puniceicoccaceae bacterium 5H]
MGQWQSGDKPDGVWRFVLPLFEGRGCGVLRTTAGKSVAAAETYFRDALPKGDYYLDGQEFAAQWGEGAGPGRSGHQG